MFFPSPIFDVYRGLPYVKPPRFNKGETPAETFRKVWRRIKNFFEALKRIFGGRNSS
jgi:hypothetical protein